MQYERDYIGGAYDTVPEVCILLALFENSDRFFPIVFDEAGTRKLNGKGNMT